MELHENGALHDYYDGYALYIFLELCCSAARNYDTFFSSTLRVPPPNL